MNDSPSILRNLGWLSAAQLIARLLQLVAYASLARRLGEIGFGRFSYAFSLLDMVAFCATLGLPILYTRHIAAGRQALAHAAVLIKHRLTGVVALFGGFWLLLAPPNLALDLLLMMFLAMLLRGYHHFGASGLRGKEQMRGEAFATVAGRLVFTLGAGGGVWLSDDLGAMLRITFVAFLLAEIVTLLMISRAMKPLGLDWSPPMPSAAQRQQTWREMLPFAAAGLMGVIAFRVDLVMLRELSDPLHADMRAGAYGAAYRILEAGLFVPAAVAAALFPALIKRGKNGKLPPELFRRALLIQLGLGLAGAAVLYFGAAFWVRLLAGPGFQEAVPALAALGFAVPFLFVNFVLGTGVFALGKEWLGFLGLTLSLLLNIFGNYWVMTRHPEQALVGAALFTAASEAVLTLSNVIILTLSRKRDQS
jgi:O-antigen/teichoic acid export membrane protein